MGSVRVCSHKPSMINQGEKEQANSKTDKESASAVVQIPSPGTIRKRKTILILPVKRN